MIYHVSFYLLCSVCRLPQWLSDKEAACNAGTEGVAGATASILGSGRLSEEGNGNPLQYSCLGDPRGQRSVVGYSPWGHEIPVARGAWWATVHGVAKSRT